MSAIDISRTRKVQSQSGRTYVYLVPETEHHADWHDADAVVYHGTRIAIGDGRHDYLMEPAHPDYDACYAAAEEEMRQYYQSGTPDASTYQQDQREEAAIRRRHLGISHHALRDVPAVGISTRL